MASYPEACDAQNKQQPQLTDQIDILDKLIYSLADQAEALEDRLGFIVRFPEPQPACSPEGSAIEQSLVPVAERVRCIRYRIETINERLNSLRNRIEL